MSRGKSRKSFLPARLSAIMLTILFWVGSCELLFCQVVSPAEKIIGEMTYDPDTKTAYVAYSKEQSIYVHLEVMDPGQQRKIVQNGLELWVDVKGKKNKKIGISYPLPDKERAFTPPGNNSADPAQRLSIRKVLEPVLARKKEMAVTGFVNEVNGMQPVHLRDGFEVSLHFRNDTLVYDAEIPVNVFAKALPVDKFISIGIVQKGLLPAGLNDGGMPDGGGMPGGGENGPPGGGGPPDGGPPDGMPPGGDEMQKAFRDNVIWFKLTFPPNMHTAQ